MILLTNSTKNTISIGLHAHLERVRLTTLSKERLLVFIFTAHSKNARQIASHKKAKQITNQLSCPTSSAKMEGNVKNLPPIITSRINSASCDTLTLFFNNANYLLLSFLCEMDCGRRTCF